MGQSAAACRQAFGLWRAQCLRGDVVPSPIFANGVVFAVNTAACLAAIRPGGEGNVTETHVVWTAPGNLPDICSPVSNGELVFTLTTQGVLTCYDADDGKMVWEKDFETSFRSSPSLVGGRVYLMSQTGVTFIVAASRTYTQISKAELGEDANTSSAFTDGRIYIRGKTHLYCVGSRQD